MPRLSAPADLYNATHHLTIRVERVEGRVDGVEHRQRIHEEDFRSAQERTNEILQKIASMIGRGVSMVIAVLLTIIGFFLQYVFTQVTGG